MSCRTVRALFRLMRLRAPMAAYSQPPGPIKGSPFCVIMEAVPLMDFRITGYAGEASTPLNGGPCALASIEDIAALAFELLCGSRRAIIFGSWQWGVLLLSPI
jgi:hypothetical protein